MAIEGFYTFVRLLFHVCITSRSALSHNPELRLLGDLTTAICKKMTWSPKHEEVYNVKEVVMAAQTPDQAFEKSFCIGFAELGGVTVSWGQRFLQC